MALASTSLKTRVFSSEICPGTDSFSDCTGEFSLSLVRLGVVPPKSGFSGRISEEALFTPAAFFESSSLPKAFLSSSIFAALIFLPSVFSLRLPPDKISSKIAGSMENCRPTFCRALFLMCVKPVSCRFFLRLTHIFLCVFRLLFRLVSLLRLNLFRLGQPLIS